MKIIITIKNDALIAINDFLRPLYLEPKPTDKMECVHRSIGYELADKFDKKCRSLVKQSTLFDSKKKHSINLKYHEAWALEELLKDYVADNNYKATLIRSVSNDLNQKLT